MAEVFVSPGVYTQEIDDTFSPPPGAAAIGAALVGYTTKGPAFLIHWRRLHRLVLQ